MKILMTADPIGGVWNYALELCGALAPCGDEVLLATLGALPSAAQRREIEALPNVTLRASDFRLEWMQDPWQSLEDAGEWLLALEREYLPDVVHLNHLVHGALPWQAPAMVVGHSCVFSWWWAVHGVHAPPEWRRYRERVRASLRAARHVVAPTRAMLSSLERWYGPLPRASVIANARSARRFSQAGTLKEPLVLAAGRFWDAAKNVGSLCEASAGIEWPVYIAGSTRGPDGTEHSQGAGARFLGELDSPELARWYARASIYALPARYEPFGLTALEAALSGCALVLGDIPSLREVWADGATYVAPDDPRALRDAVNALIANPRRRVEQARRAMDRSARFRPAELARGYRRIHASLLDQQESSACASYSSITR